MEIVFHHHCAGYVETPDEVRELLARTDPELVGLCLDTGHWHYAGGDAVQCINEYGKRVRYLHFKDCDPKIAAQCRAEKKDYFEAVKAGVFCVLGQGEVDFPGVIKAALDHGYDDWAIVEQDILNDDPTLPKKVSQANRNYLKGLGL
jgi:inosose dehydratase